ncbi:MAG: hypothetical protein KTR33_12540 [Gammaproteobacteria bacterium]|nr:hypothetical protein [Gammaproteobacteria bacterium]
MNATQAKLLERSIITLCVASIIMIFQPFSMQLFTIGCILVVVGALLFNLVPFCRAGVPARQIGKVVLIVLIVLVVAALLGVGTAFLYVEYLESLR